MITDTEIKLNGMKALVDNLGLVEAERFIVLIQREPFDYTKWRESLWKGKTAREISSDAIGQNRITAINANWRLGIKAMDGNRADSANRFAIIRQ